MFTFILRWDFKNFSHFKSIDVTPFILKLRCILCAACGTVWSRFWGVSVHHVVLWWVCVGIVVSVCRHCVVVSRRNLMAAVLRNIHLFS